MKDSGNNVLESFAYDGVNRRVSTTASSTTTDLYYSAEWQVLEERVGGNTTMQYVWSPVYVDAMILRDRDTDANGSLDETTVGAAGRELQRDGVVNGSGSVVERYAYDPFGSATVYDASWGCAVEQQLCVGCICTKAGGTTRRAGCIISGIGITRRRWAGGWSWIRLTLAGPIGICTEQ